MLPLGLWCVLIVGVIWLSACAVQGDSQLPTLSDTPYGTTITLSDTLDDAAIAGGDLSSGAGGWELESVVGEPFMPTISGQGGLLVRQGFDLTLAAPKKISAPAAPTAIQ